MNDYASHINFSEKEGQAHLILFAELDPITYAHAVQSDKMEESNGCRNCSDRKE
jgi:hypothetical protein